MKPSSPERHAATSHPAAERSSESAVKSGATETALGLRLLWFILLWGAGVTVLGLIGFFLRWVITSIYGG